MVVLLSGYADPLLILIGAALVAHFFYFAKIQGTENEKIISLLWRSALKETTQLNLL